LNDKIHTLQAKAASEKGLTDYEKDNQKLIRQLIYSAYVSSGTSGELDKYRPLYNYTLAPGKTPNDIEGMGIAGSNDRVYVWYHR